MSLVGAPKTNMAGPEMDNIDGYRFLSFEKLEELDIYLKQNMKHRPQPIQSQCLKKADKASKKPSKAGSSSATKPKVTKAKKPAKKVPVWLKHKRRLRKGDKRVIVDKVHGFVFVSAFTLDDFDEFAEEIETQVDAAPSGVKRKSPTTSPPSQTAAKKSKHSTQKFSDVSNIEGLGTSSLGAALHVRGKNLAKHLAKHIAKPASKHAGYVEKPASKHAGYVKKPASKHSGYVEKPASKHSGYVEKPASKHSGYVEKPASKHSGYVEKPASKHSGYVEKPASKHSGYVEEPASKHSGYVEKPAGYVEKPASKHAGYAEKPASKHSGNVEKPASKHSGNVENPASKHAGNVENPASKHLGHHGLTPIGSTISDLDHLQKLTSSINVDGRGNELCSGQPFTSMQEKHGVETNVKINDRSKQYPHMQIDDTYDGTVSSDSDGSVITVSDEPDHESTFLDVINVDSDSSSAKFIQNSIRMVNDTGLNETGVNEVLEEKRPESDNAKKAKKKKCKMCCIYPSKIVEAKKICPLFGAYFPSYTVSCVSTCKQHPPGEIVVMFNESKPGFVDTCIQTNAPDIKMHQDFAHRFPHRTIAVTTHCTRMLEDPRPRGKKAPVFFTPPEHHHHSKSEHHRTSEQKRRVQMHDQFTELRKVITKSQAIPDNHRASKQWILEHGKEAIAALEAETSVLETTQKSLVGKNERLKKRWKELYGKEFDHSVCCNKIRSGQTKLMNLYKQYRKNMQRNNACETTPKSPPTVVHDGAESSQPSNMSEAVTNDGSLACQCTSGEVVAGKASMDCPIDELSRASFGKNSNVPNSLMHVKPLNDTVFKKMASQDMNQSSRALPTSNLNQTSLKSRSSVATPVLAGRQSKGVSGITAICDLATNKTSQVTGTNNPASQTTSLSRLSRLSTVVTNLGVNNPGQVSTPKNSSQTTSAGIQNQTKTGSIPVSSQSPVARKIPDHPRAVNNQTPPSVLPSSQATLPKKPSQDKDVNKPAIAVRMPNGTIAVRMPSTVMAVNMAKQIITTLEQPDMANMTAINIPTQVIGPIMLNKPRLLIPLEKLNQALMNRKPTQWTTMSKLSQSEVNETSVVVDDVGAMVEVGGAGDEQNHLNDIVLLDVTQMDHKLASTSGDEQVRTLSFLPTSSSINVTLKSVGSITANKVFNKKPVPSKQRSFTSIQVNQAENKTSSKPVQEITPSKEKTEANLPSGAAPEPTLDDLPRISESLLAFQDDKSIDGDNEPGLCVISSVFSLSDAEFKDTSNPNTGKCDRADGGKQLGAHVGVNCNATFHDHNYFIKSAANFVTENETVKKDLNLN